MIPQNPDNISPLTNLIRFLAVIGLLTIFVMGVSFGILLIRLLEELAPNMG